MAAIQNLLERIDEVSAREMFVVLLEKFESQSEEINRLGLLLQDFMDADDNRVYNLDQVATVLKVHIATVRKWIREGHLEYVPGTKYKCIGRHLKSFLQKTQKSGFSEL
jgi:hypothetical protein